MANAKHIGKQPKTKKTSDKIVRQNVGVTIRNIIFRGACVRRKMGSEATER